MYMMNSVWSDPPCSPPIIDLATYLSHLFYRGQTPVTNWRGREEKSDPEQWYRVLPVAIPPFLVIVSVSTQYRNSPDT